MSKLTLFFSYKTGEFTKSETYYEPLDRCFWLGNALIKNYPGRKHVMVEDNNRIYDEYIIELINDSKKED